MSNITELKLKKEKESVDSKIKVTMKSNNSVKIINAEYFGMMEGFLNFIGFWKNGSEVPHIMIDGELISSIEILEEDKIDG